MSKLTELKEYRNHKFVNQSLLKRVLTDTVDEEFEPKIHFLIGNAVDTKLTTPNLFNELYYISDLQEYPLPQIKEAMDIAFNGDEIENSLDILIKIFRTISNVRTGDDKMKEKFLSDRGYWDELIEAKGRKIISREYYNKVELTAASFISHPNVSEHFNAGIKGVKVAWQVPIYWKIEDVDCKGLLDNLTIDYNNKTVQIKDIKTTDWKLWEFDKQARKMRPDFQLSFYYDGISKLFPDFKQLAHYKIWRLSSNNVPTKAYNALCTLLQCKCDN